MKKPQTKQKILFSLSIIFLITSASISVYKTAANFKSISFNKNNNDVTEGIDVENLQNEREIKNKILPLVETLGEAVDYIKNNLSEKKLAEVIIITDDCINALYSIENGINKLSNKEEINDLIKQTKILRSYFHDLKLALEKGDIEKSSNIISSIKKEYICLKTQINYKSE
ncbi:hypothetical protein [Clostridium lundense]|uniref:hypothetical protein n=1 Tax=Clostridium lundense TaxID=319475 RepID=UPI0004896D2F|nr:hypothetical protein [Clostridium lundense]